MGKFLGQEFYIFNFLVDYHILITFAVFDKIIAIFDIILIIIIIKIVRRYCFFTMFTSINKPTRI